MSGIVDSQRQMAIVQDAAGEFIARDDPHSGGSGHDHVFRSHQWRAVYSVRFSWWELTPEAKLRSVPSRHTWTATTQSPTKARSCVPPLRPTDTAPGWELTDHARTYRKMMKQQQMLFLQEEIPLTGIAVPAPQLNGVQTSATDSDSDVAPPVFSDASEKCIGD